MSLDGDQRQTIAAGGYALYKSDVICSKCGRNIYYKLDGHAFICATCWLPMVGDANPLGGGKEMIYSARKS